MRSHFSDPIRAHLEILNDFVLGNLDVDFGISNFVRLHEAWQRRLGSYALSSDFYREIADWYFWAHHQVEDGTIRLPVHCDTDQERSLFLIRLLTRVIFCWFLVEKRLIPSDLFREHRLKSLLKEFNPSKDPRKPDGASTYYRAVLQNLFFGTLNMPPSQRAFREKRAAGERYDKNFGITNLWRYEIDFSDHATWHKIAARVPFLNGGLFDCLDDKAGKQNGNRILDGYSDNPKLTCHLPNDLFFGPERTVDLSRDYGEEDKRTARSKKAKVRGLVEILSRYKFTIEENTPLEEEIALDPELLGKVFENLLASFNEDTQTTARKALGAFYTPREIVSYMVDEALKSYLGSQVPRCKGALEDLFSNKASSLRDIRPDTQDALIAAIGRVKILDPACGSGAFPMGALHRLVDLLQKLDPNNDSWKRDRLAEARRDRHALEKAGVTKEEVVACDARIREIEKSFDTRFHALDFARKLYLIENCIYGVDIQPIATQIAKLRFFISLIVDQKIDAHADNLGVRPLPNLETRLVAADTLISIEKPESDLFSDAIDKLRGELAAIRHEHFNARSPSAKRRWRDADDTKRHEIARFLEDSHFLSHESAHKLAAWDPYDQNTFAAFFDPEWMFGLKPGSNDTSCVSTTQETTEVSAARSGPFDIVIGNPPYVRADEQSERNQLQRRRILDSKQYETLWEKWDLYIPFIERSYKLLSPNGITSLIVPDAFCHSKYAQKSQEWFLRNARILRIDFCSDIKIFDAAVHNMIFFFQRADGAKWKPERRIHRETFGVVELLSTDEQARLSYRAFFPEDRSRGTISISSSQLGAACYISVGMVVHANERVAKGAFELKDVVSSTRDKAHSRRFIEGKHLGRWLVRKNMWLEWGTDRAPALFRRPTFPELYDVPEKLLIHRTAGEDLRTAYDAEQTLCNHTVMVCLPWHALRGVRNKSITKAARYKGETPPRPDLPDREALEMESRKYAVKYLLGLMNSAAARHHLRANRRSNTDLYPEDWKKLPVPDVPSNVQETLVRVVDVIVWTLRTLAVLDADKGYHRDTRDPLMMAYWERISNGLVHELYFPEEVRKADLQLFQLVDHAQLPDMGALPEADRLKALRTKFEELYDGTHPLRIALDKLHTLDSVRIIEGNA